MLYDLGQALGCDFPDAFLDFENKAEIVRNSEAIWGRFKEGDRLIGNTDGEVFWFTAQFKGMEGE
jgi:hypothetical protein